MSHTTFTVVYPAGLYAACNALNIDKLARWFTGREGLDYVALSAYLLAGLCLFIAFFAAFGLFVGYSIGIAFVVIAMMKPIFPNNVGFWMTPNGILVSSGVNFPSVREGLVFHTSYWIIPGALLIGFGLLLVTHVLARRWIAWFRNRRKWRPAFGAGLG